MKNIFKFSSLLLLILSFSMLSSCKKDPHNTEEHDRLLSEFVKVDAPSVYVKGDMLVEFNKETEQIASSEDKLEYMVSNMTFDKLYILNFSASPETYSQFTVNCSSVGLSNLTFTGKDMSIVRETEDMYWLWDSKDYVGIVIKFHK